jgi:hypothetical protein
MGGDWVGGQRRQKAELTCMSPIGDTPWSRVQGIDKFQEAETLDSPMAAGSRIVFARHSKKYEIGVRFRRMHVADSH